jgi:D-alanyl-lipoteichoic acid acyltransferase DltB (MBOAT superfamily)
MKGRNIIRSILVTQLVLLIPLVAMQFSEEWDWKPFDFIVVGILLAGVGFAYELIAHGAKNNPKQAAAGIALAVSMVLIWVELAVGILD